MSVVGDGLLLDIGGWASPFRRADYVVDLCPYETRGIGYHGIGKWPRGQIFPSPLDGERFSRKTWIIHDICGSAPLPFPDKMFDFVVCSHTLEDIRDPIRACAEILRVAKAGYIETPSRLWEQTIRQNGIVGEGHHRWMVEIHGAHIRFFGKPHFLHTNRKYYLPMSFVERERSEADKIAFLFWEGQFTFEEASTYWYQDVEAFVKRQGVDPRYYRRDRLDRIRDHWWQLESRVLAGMGRRRTAAPCADAWTWETLFEENARLMAGRSVQA